MKQLYYLLILCGSLSWVPMQAQNWRPFRPNGDVHAFRGASADTILTLRLDSAAISGTDSLYFFNRIMQQATSVQWQKSRNNQFGQLMRYNAEQRSYVLFWNGGPTPIYTLDIALVLKPFARVGETWTSTYTDVGMLTTLLSRGTSLVDGVSDSIATFRVGNSMTVVLSKNYGLVSAPASLQVGNPNARMLTLVRRPAPAGLSYYNPIALLDLQSGDELGYEQEPAIFSTFPCYAGWLLRRVLSRQTTADSVVYTFQQQSQLTYSNTPGCPGTGLVTAPIATIRLSASRRTGRWSQATGANATVLPSNTDLLAYEYRADPDVATVLTMGHPVVSNRAGNTCGGFALLRQQKLYRSGSSSTYQYSPGIDILGWQQLIGAGVGVISQYEHKLVYSRRASGGTIQTCGNRANFGTLLPTSVVRRALVFTLHPNPATESVTLTLPAPGLGATVVRLLDGLGRIAKQQQLATGQTSANLPLQDVAPGLYIVEVQAAGQSPQRLRLQH